MVDAGLTPLCTCRVFHVSGTVLIITPKMGFIMSYSAEEESEVERGRGSYLRCYPENGGPVPSATSDSQPRAFSARFFRGTSSFPSVFLHVRRLKTLLSRSSCSELDVLLRASVDWRKQHIRQLM